MAYKKRTNNVVTQPVVESELFVETHDANANANVNVSITESLVITEIKPEVEQNDLIEFHRDAVLYPHFNKMHAPKHDLELIISNGDGWQQTI